MTTTLTVLATLVAVPFLIGILLAIGLGFFMALHFAAEWTRGLRSGSGLSRQDRAVRVRQEAGKNRLRRNIIAGSCCSDEWVRVKARHGGGQASQFVGKRSSRSTNS
jgi:hypothetical protein